MRQRICARDPFTSRRRGVAIALGLLALLCACGGGGGGSHGGGGSEPNAIQRENAETGSEAWQFWRFGERAADDTTEQIKGYASATSVDRGETITFHVSVNPPQAYTIDVFRLGWYGGAGGRLMTTIDGLQGTRQPACPMDATTGLIACAWEPSVEVLIADSWTTGIYLAVLHGADHFANLVPFVVRDDAHPPTLLYQQSVTTYQAYNLYPNDGARGKSLYGSSFGPPTISGGTRAVAVSFDRPYADDGAGDLLKWEIHLVRWLERSGYDVGYATDLDTHARGAHLLASRAFIVAGHDEYWSREMRDAVEAARDAGVHLAFLGANAGYWQVRFSPSASGAADRVMTCYKDAALDPVQGPTTTVRWRDPLPGRAEQRLIGVQYTDVIAGGIGGAYAGYTVADAASWIYAGTGLADGDVVPGILGYETDRLDPAFPPPDSVAGTYEVVGASPFTNFAGLPAVANASVYQAPSGAWVFAAGTIGWSLGLDDSLDRQVSDPRIQRATANVLARFTAPR